MNLFGLNRIYHSFQNWDYDHLPGLGKRAGAGQSAMSWKCSSQIHHLARPAGSNRIRVIFSILTTGAETSS
jgi:hypothetical protein